MRKCTKCSQEKEEKDFYKIGVYWCRSCRNAYSRAYMKRTYRKSARKIHFLNKFGLSLDDWDVIYNRQGGKCLICLRHASTLTMPLCIDHDHEIGKVRGLLCKECNSALGFFHDNPYTIYRAFKHLEYKLPKSPRQPETVEDVLRPNGQPLEAKDKEPRR